MAIQFVRLDGTFTVIKDGARTIGNISCTYPERRHPWTVEIKDKHVVFEEADCFTMVEAKRAARWYLRDKLGY